MMVENHPAQGGENRECEVQKYIPRDMYCNRHRRLVVLLFLAVPELRAPLLGHHIIVRAIPNSPTASLLANNIDLIPPPISLQKRRRCRPAPSLCFRLRQVHAGVAQQPHHIVTVLAVRHHLALDGTLKFADEVLLIVHQATDWMRNSGSHDQQPCDRPRAIDTRSHRSGMPPRIDHKPSYQ